MYTDIFSINLIQLTNIVNIDKLINFINCDDCKDNLISNIDKFNNGTCSCINYSCFLCMAVTKKILIKYLYKVKCDKCRFKKKILMTYDNSLIQISPENTNIRISREIHILRDRDLILEINPQINKLFCNFSWEFERILWIGIKKNNNNISKLDYDIIKKIIKYLNIEDTQLIQYIFLYLKNNNHLLQFDRVYDQLLDKIAIPFNKYYFDRIYGKL